jgi:mRNA-degrading endonuclease RelE of RelBE toxin-antitoxin system
MKIFQSRSFEKKVKKLFAREKEILDREIKKIAVTPSLGEEKKGDLKGIFVHKFRIQSIQYLVAYRMVENNLELIMFGTHENYYKDLKSYLKNRQ